LQMQGYMPIFVNSTVPTEGPVAVAPDAELLQPAPVDPNVKKIKDAKANVECYKRRVKCTSWMFIIIGCIGMVASLYYQFTAKHHAMKIANFPPHQGGRHGKHHEPQHKLEDEPKYVSRVEFNIYDAIKTLTAITFFLSAKIVALGKCGKWMTYRNKSWATKWLAKKSCCCLALIVLVGIFAAKEGHHIHHLKMKVLKAHEGEEGWPSPQEDDERHGGRHHGRHGGRHLQNIEETQAPMYFTEEEYSQAKEFMAEILTDDEDECNALNNAGSCKANSKCSWCTAGAVADACHSIENAGRLPPAVFACDPLPSEFEQRVWGKHQGNHHGKHHGRHGKHHGKHQGKHHGKHHEM